MTELGALGTQLHTNVGGAPLDERRFAPVFDDRDPAGRRGLDPPDAQPGLAGLPGGEPVEVRHLVVAGLAVRDVGVHGAPGVLGRLRHLSGPAGDHPPRGRHGAALRRAAGVAAGGPRPGRRSWPAWTRDPMDYFRRFYADTAMFGAAHAVRCAVEFFGTRSRAVRDGHAARRPHRRRGHDRRHRGARPAGRRRRRDLRAATPGGYCGSRPEAAARVPRAGRNAYNYQGGKRWRVPSRRTSALGRRSSSLPGRHRPVRRVHGPGVLLGLRDPAGRRRDQRVGQGRRRRLAAVGAPRRRRRVRARLDRVELRQGDPRGRVAV